MTAVEKLQKIYEAEINVEISSFFDSGWSYRIGDSVNGFRDPVRIGEFENFESCVDDLHQELILRGKIA